jgi:putative ABC transport system ATP-binding protein
MAVVIRAAGLKKAYRTGRDVSPILAGVDLTVRRGECVFLIGPSGSGKTTLLSILGCVLTADSGALEIRGQDVARLSPAGQARFRRETIGFVFQRFHLFEALTAAENVAVPLDLLGRPKVESRRRALELLALVGLRDQAASRVNRLSMGQRQRVAFARALAGNPELILADEPTASLDAETGFAAMRLLKDLCRDLGKTVVVVTHDSRIFPMADRILRLAEGGLVDEPSRPCGLEDSSVTAIRAA